jgi:hypothetical protein
MTVLFLDFDDVLCLNSQFGGYDVMHALAAVERGEKHLEDFAELWASLFEQSCKDFLACLHSEFKPTYVLSTSWTRFMNRSALAATLHATGLGFVAQHLHPHWETIKAFSTVRAQEIGHWLAQHPKYAQDWVALDDHESGVGLKNWPNKADKSCIVLCKVNSGLTDVEYQQLRGAFLYRQSQLKG